MTYSHISDSFMYSNFKWSCIHVFILFSFIRSLTTFQFLKYFMLFFIFVILSVRFFCKPYSSVRNLVFLFYRSFQYFSNCMLVKYLHIFIYIPLNLNFPISSFPKFIQVNFCIRFYLFYYFQKFLTALFIFSLRSILFAVNYQSVL